MLGRFSLPISDSLLSLLKTIGDEDSEAAGSRAVQSTISNGGSNSSNMDDEYAAFQVISIINK